MKATNFTFHHKTIDQDKEENFNAIKQDMVAREIPFSVDEKTGNIKRESDHVVINVLTLEELLEAENGEKLFEQIVHKIVMSDQSVRKAVVNGEDLPEITPEKLAEMLASKKKGSGATRFKAAEKKALTAQIIADYFSEIPEAVQKALTAVFEAGASKARLTALNNMEFVEKLLHKMVELAEQEEDTNTSVFMTQLAEAMDAFLSEQRKQAEQLENIEL